MTSANERRGTGSGEAKPSPMPRLLLMSEKRGDLAACRDQLRLPMYRVQKCSDYVELLLHLQHEVFQLVIIFEGENTPPEWKTVIKQAAEASGGTPILVFKRTEDLTNFAGTLAS